ncbi:hypothetical protein HPB50_002063 [Hyalomma asiaticum]|uniref:Uncharacterized protein n=1 Tax=Hyalomma asiaticum TaxID=266040 RepID=A0ACB7T7Y9_HYAAI|nr:hypothetical protein HPB50_002063 [Hyalomma asiaticum]
MARHLVVCLLSVSMASVVTSSALGTSVWSRQRFRVWPGSWIIEPAAAATASRVVVGVVDTTGVEPGASRDPLGVVEPETNVDAMADSTHLGAARGTS